MPVKGALQPDGISKNNFRLTVVGILVPELTVVSLGSLEEEVKKVDLPDNTSASGGDTNPITTTFSIPLHHLTEVAACEAWMLEGKGPVSPGYKKAAILSYISISNTSSRDYALEGVWITKRVLPEGEMSDDGELQVVEYEVSIDSILPIG